MIIGVIFERKVKAGRNGGGLLLLGALRAALT